MNTRRVLIYCLGLIIAAFGLALNVNSCLGVAPILTVPRIIAQILNYDFSNILFGFYVMFIILQIPILGKNFRAKDLLQFPVGLAFSKMVGLFTNLIPVTEGAGYGIRFTVLALAVIFTGIGVAIFVDMDLVANPPDGLSRAIGERFSLGLGMGKNIVDLTSVAIAFVISMARYHSLGSIGIGTLAAGLLVGRVIALFNKAFLVRLRAFAGLEKQGDKNESR